MSSASIQKYSRLLAFYLLLALILTYPLALNLTTHIPGHDTDGPAQTWSLWWTRYAVMDLGRAPFTTDYIFYPLGLNLVAYTPVFLNGVLSIPLQYVFGVIVAQNLMVFFALVSGAFGAYLFVREVLTRDGTSSQTSPRVASQAQEGAAVLAGALYGFGAWHLNYVVAGHFMLMSNQWLPYYALYLMRLERGRWRNAVMAGLFLILTAWTELTYLPFLALLTLFYLVYLAWKRRSVMWRTIQSLLLAGGIAAVGISPLVVSLAFDFERYGYYLTSGVGRIQIFSAEPISFFLPSGQHPFLGAWAESITRANTSYAFIGWAVLVFALVGFYITRRVPLARFWLVSALLFALLMFGSTLYIGGVNTNIPMPFALLRLVPFVNANRYPARFNVMLMLVLLPLFAWGILAFWTAGRSSLKIVLVGLLAGLALEQLVLPIPLTRIQAPSIFGSIREEPGDFTVLELPLGWRGSIVMQGKTDDVAQFFQTTDHKRRLGGITSRFPDFKLRYFRDLPVVGSLIALEEGRAVSEAQLQEDKTALADILRFFDIRYVSVNRAETDAEAWNFARDLFPLQEVFSDAERTVYRVALPPPALTMSIHPADETSRLYFDDTWGAAQEDAGGFGYRWATDGAARILLPLDDAPYQMTFRLRGAHADQHVSLRVNGQDVAQWSLTDSWNEYKAIIPQAALRDGLDEFRFVTDTTTPDKAVPDDRTIGNTGIVSPVDITATGAGFDAGKFGEIYIAGKNVIPNTRGYHLVAINPRTGNVDGVGNFDTFADMTASKQLSDFVAALPLGEIVAGAAIDDASQKLSGDALSALRTLGVSGNLRKQFRAGHAFVGIRGSAEGQAVEDLNGAIPATVTIGKNLNKPYVVLALGPFEAVRMK